jgi:hypothetical protein
LKDKLASKEETPENLSIKDLDMSEIIPQSFNGTLVSIIDDKHTLILPVGMDQGKFKTFRKSNGGVFNKDVLAFKRNKEHGKYVLIEGNRERKIVRLIEDTDLLLFQSLRLIKGIIKDKPYMLIRNLGPKDILTSNGRYIEKENSEHEEEIEVMAVQPLVKPAEEDHESIGSSVSLFDE